MAGFKIEYVRADGSMGAMVDDSGELWVAEQDVAETIVERLRLKYAEVEKYARLSVVNVDTHEVVSEMEF